MTEAHAVAQCTLLDSTGAAAFLLLDEKTITRWARKGHIPAHPMGEGKRKSWRFVQQELTDWLFGRHNRNGGSGDDHDQ
jgi:hypothetical protein